MKTIKYWENKKEVINSLSFDEYIKVFCDVLRELGYNIIETKQELNLFSILAICNGKKYLFCVKKEAISEFEDFADLLDEMDRYKCMYDKVCYVHKMNKNDVYEKLFIKCCSAKDIVIINENAIKEKIDIVVKKHKNESKNILSLFGYKKKF